ncbi:MAG TPA: nicotinamidase [Candidatus Limnocylindrales bacterium]|nr:nicotinamidase [Candidatus Limnocylindrales bacterium]
MSLGRDSGTERAALLVVDVQPDFLPGGALAVADGDAILQPIVRLMASGRFRLQVATQDWHPLGHVSCASSHSGKIPLDVIDLYGHEQVLWPDHCVQGTLGAELQPGLPWDGVAAVIRKGADPRCDSYSAFRNNWDPEGARPPTGLAGYLRERTVERVYLCGLARDYCVRWSAEDAVAAGFETCFLWDLTRSVDPAGDDALRDSLEAVSVRIVDSASLR